MIDLNKNFIVIKGQVKTREIDSIELSSSLGFYIVKFLQGNKIYHIKRNHVLWLKNPERLDPQSYHVYANGMRCYNIVSLLLFTYGFNSYYHIEYASGTTDDYKGTDIKLEKSCLAEEGAKNVFQYLSEVALSNGLKDDDGNILLYNLYVNTSFIDEEVCVASYLSPERYKIKKHFEKDIILPFGCNNSQIKAVRNTFDSQISVIQGPPGTGKTQTILNIIANIIKQGKTVIVVSNNNSATTNVLEKLAKDKMDFFVAPLGRSENKSAFVEYQSKGRIYPTELYEWESDVIESEEFLDELRNDTYNVQQAFTLQEKLAEKRLELSDVKKEWYHYKTNFGDYNDEETTISSSKIARIMSELQDEEQTSLFAKLTNWFKLWFYRIRYKADRSLIESRTDVNMHRLRALFYKRKIKELENDVTNIETQLDNIDVTRLTNDIKEKSKKYFKGYLYKKYCVNHTPFTINDERSLSMVKNVLDEFPVVLSTTFSSVNSLKGVVYDYL